MPDHKNLKSIIFAGSLIACSVLSPATILANSQNLFDYSALGSGAHVRAALLKESLRKNNSLELKCGNDSKTKDTKNDKSSESKCGEGKCGEGKCGEKTATDSTKTNSSVTETHNKTKDAKCGEGKCGN